MKIILARIFDFILITLTKLFKWILKFKWSNLHIYLHKINSIFNFIYFLNILKNSLKILKILTMFFGGTTMFLFTEFQYDDFYNYINIIYDNLYNYYKNVIEYIIEKLHNLISHSPFPIKGGGGSGSKDIPVEKIDDVKDKTIFDSLEEFNENRTDGDTPGAGSAPGTGDDNNSQTKEDYNKSNKTIFLCLAGVLICVGIYYFRDDVSNCSYVIYETLTPSLSPYPAIALPLWEGESPAPLRGGIRRERLQI